MWKVPFRRVYCDTFKIWVRSTLWCHFVVRVFPYARDFRTDGLVDYYFKEPHMFFEQYRSVLKEVLNGRDK